MKLTPEKARQLRAQGFQVDRQQIVREPKAEVKEVPPPKPDYQPAILDGLVQAAQANENNTKSILSITAAMLETIAGIAKPKPLKKWKCQVGRNSRGEISTVDINEV